jgi:two-component system response regulator YesN
MVMDRKDAKGKPSVLVVDDEAEIREEVMDALIDEGLTVFEASSVDEALITISENREIEVVVADLRMPHRLGVDLVTEMAGDDTRNICVIIMTGHVSGDLGITLTGLNVFSVLSKPVDCYELIETVNLAMRSMKL